MIAKLLAEAGRLDEAIRMQSEAGANDIVRIQGGVMELVDIGPP